MKTRPHNLLLIWGASVTLLTTPAAHAADPVAWFRLDEGSGNTVYSAVGGYSGSGTALSWASTGLAPVSLIPATNNVAGTTAALIVSGVSSAVGTTTYNARSGNTSRSYSAWIKCGPQTLGTSGPTIVGINDAGTGTGVRFDMMIDSTGTLRVERNGGSLAGSTVVTNNAWHHVALTYGPNTVNIYVDGVKETSVGSFTLNIAASKVVSIGDNPVKAGGSSSRVFTGQIDDARVYDVVLSTNDIQQLAFSPAITNNMASQTNASGNATFNSGITAFGAGAAGLTNQWTLDGVDVAAETGSSYSVIGAAVGTHAIAVRSGNSYGMVTNAATYVVLSASPTITAAPSAFPASVSTTYGTHSSSTSVAVSGSNLVADITAAAPAGFEVSSNNTTFGSTATFAQSGGTASGTLYLRLKNNAPVAGTYDLQNVALSSTAANAANVPTAASGNSVSPKALTVASAAVVDKLYDGTTAAIVTASLQLAEAFDTGSGGDGAPYTGDTLTLTCNGSTFVSVGPGTGITVTAGTYVLGGASAGNYTLTQPGFVLSANIYASAVWANAADGAWTNSANWLNNLVGSGTDVTADFGSLTLTSNTTVTLDSALTAGNLVFADQGANYNWIIKPDTGGPLTLSATAAGPVINVSNQTATIGAVLAGTNGLTKTGNGTLTLTNRNTISGGATVGAGTLICNTPSGVSPGCLGGGNVTVNNGATVIVSQNNSIFGGSAGTNYTLTINSGGLVKMADGTGYTAHLNSLVLNGGTLSVDTVNATYGTWNLDGGVLTSGGGATSSLTGGNGKLSQSGGTVFNVGTGDTLQVSTILNHFSGANGDTGLIKAGGGRLVLSSANSYTGATTVSNGVLEIPASGSLGASAVTVNSNGVLAAGGSLSGSVTIQSGGSLVPTTVTTNTPIGPSLSIVGSLVLNGTVTFRISKDGGYPTYDQILASAGATYGGRLAVTNVTTDATPLAAGDKFYLFSGSPLSEFFASYILPALPNGLNWDMSGLQTSGLIEVVNAVATPIFNPVAGGYVSPQSVTISSDAGSRIFYTTDGSTPTIASPSGLSPVVVPLPADTASITLMAYATNAGLPDSTLASAVYSTTPVPTWISPYGGSWAGGYNWSNNVTPNAIGVMADFSTLPLMADPIVTLDGAQTVGNLLFADQSGNNYAWTLNPGSGGTLTLAVNSGSPTISNGVATTIGVPLAGSQGLTKTGNGMLTLTKACTYSGATTIGAGTMRLDSSSLANATSMLSSSDINNSTAVTFYRNATGYVNIHSRLSGAGDYYVDTANPTNYFDNRVLLSGSGADNTGTICVTNYGSLWIQVTGAGTAIGDACIVDVGSNGLFVIHSTTTSETIGGLAGSGYVCGNSGSSLTTLGVGGGDRAASFSGVIANTAGNGGRIALTKVGNGTQILYGTNTYTGATTVSNGTLLVNGSLAAGSAVTVNSGGVLGGTGTINGAITVQSGGTLQPGAGGSVTGTLTVKGALNLAGSTVMYLNKAAVTNSRVASTSTIAYGGTLAVTNLGGTLTAGDSFPLFSGAGATNVSNFAVIAGSPGEGLAFSFTNGVLSVVASSVTPPPATLTNSVSGSTLSLSWPAGQGWKLQWQTNGLNTGLGTNWMPLTDATVSSTNIPVDPARPAVFYRLAYP